MFLACFSVAEVSPVSTLAVLGRAVVMAVSRWPASAAAVVPVVTSLPRCRVLCAKKFALRAQNTPKSAFFRLLGELFRGRSAGGAVLGEFFRGDVAGGAVSGEFFRAVGLAAGPIYWRPR